MEVSEFVYAGNDCIFRRYRNGNFFYEVERKNTGDIYEFPIPIEDITGVTLLDKEKSVHLMRWIRGSITNKTMIKISSAEELRQSPVELKD